MYFSTEELFNIERMFKDKFNVPSDLVRALIYEFQDLKLHDLVRKKREDIDKDLIMDWGVHKEIILPYIVIRLIKPKVILETGTGIGVSAAYILEALNRNGIKAEFHTMGIQSLNMTDYPLGYAIPDYLKYNDLIDYYQYPVIIQRNLPELIEILSEKHGQIDIFIHDSEHGAENMYWELETALPESDFLFVHDIQTNNGFLRFIEDYCLEGRAIYYIRDQPFHAELGLLY